MADTNCLAYMGCDDDTLGLNRYCDVYVGQPVTDQAGNGLVEDTDLDNKSKATVVVFLGPTVTFLTQSSPHGPRL